MQVCQNEYGIINSLKKRGIVHLRKDHKKLSRIMNGYPVVPKYKNLCSGKKTMKLLAIQTICIPIQQKASYETVF